MENNGQFVRFRRSSPTKDEQNVAALAMHAEIRSRSTRSDYSSGACANFSSSFTATTTHASDFRRLNQTIQYEKKTRSTEYTAIRFLDLVDSCWSMDDEYISSLLVRKEN